MKVNVDIIILSFNGILLLKECLNSIRKQSILPNKIIVVDNGSTDQTSNLIPKEFPEVEMIKIKNNLGIPKAFNVALDACKSEYVAWLNNDVTLDSLWLEKMYYFIKKRPEVASCDSMVMYSDNKEIIWSMGGTYTVWGSCRFKNQGKNINEVINLKNEENSITVGCAAIYRKSVFVDIGVLDESFFLGFEDVDWSLRALLAGYKNYNVSSALAYHKVSQTIIIGSEQYVRCGQRNVTAVFIKNTPKILLFLMSPFHLFYQLCAFLYYSSKRRGYSWLKGKLDNLKLYSNYKRDRKIIQSNKKISNFDFFKYLKF